MYCPNCGKENAEDSNFCRHCGSVFDYAKSNLNNVELSNVKEKVYNIHISLKAILLSIAIGIWMLVLQNLGIIPISQDVNVVKQKGRVDVYVEGGSIDVDNTVDVNVNNL